jgi:hypothetical protein
MPMMSNKVKFGEGQCLVNLKGGVKLTASCN